MAVFDEIVYHRFCSTVGLANAALSEQKDQ
jgi:hypothetical protein